MLDKKRRRSSVDDDLRVGANGDDVMLDLDAHDTQGDDAEVVLVEPFYGGSHKQLIDLLVAELLKPRGIRHAVCTLPPRKWHWRLMASSMYFSTTIPTTNALRVLFVTSMVNLAELLGLRPDLNQPGVRKIYYFHENQLTYPYQVPTTSPVDEETKNAQRRQVAAEDFHIGWSQILSCLAADELVFNSDFNRSSFFSRVDVFINKIPEQQLRYRDLAKTLRAKSSVLYFPLRVPASLSHPTKDPSQPLTILWNHRWEYDKNPDEFFETLFELDKLSCKFQLIVLGEAFKDTPPIFETARDRLHGSDNVTIVHWGYAPSRERYFELLQLADVVISTSLHEFYGVAVLEAVLCGCYPLVPNRLVYPEFFSGSNVYNTQRQLVKKLKYFCSNPFPARKFYKEHGEVFTKFTWSKLAALYETVLLQTPTTT